MPISISKLPEVTNVKDNSFMLITQDGTTKRTMCDQFVTEEEARLDEFSPTVITSKSMSKTGEGDNVDYSSSVYDAPMKDVVLKGKTMVNCIQEPSSQDVVLPYEFEDGQYVTINDTKESGALGVELKGQTLVNLLGELTIDLSSSLWSEDENNYILDLATGNGQPTLSFRTLYTLPANKTYTLFINMTSYTTGLIHIDFRTPSNTSSSSNQRYFGEAGWQKLVFTTTEETAFVRMFNRNGVDNTFSISKSLILLEGDHTNTPIPNYFTGMASCKMPILHTVGKNLFDGKWIENSGNSTSLYSNPIKVIPNRYYKINLNTTEHIKGITVYFYDINGNVINYQNRVIGLSPNESVYMKWYITRFSDMTKDYLQTITQIEEIQNESSTSTSYEPYKSSILSTPSDLILRGIGDVQDTLNLTTGEYTKAIYEYTFTGDENWVISGGNDGGYTYFSFSNRFLPVNFDESKKVNIPISCDKLPTITYSDFDNGLKNVGINLSFFFRLNFSDCNSNNGATVEDLRAYLKANPTTVQYPIIKSVETVDLEVVDQNGSIIPTLKSWNTTTHIYSEIPENTLYPILSHSNPSYPVILKPSTKYSIIVNSYSNDHTNSAINFNLGGATASTTVGNRVTTITTPSTLSNELLTMSGRGNKLNNVMVIEGDVAGDEPYFEGICDVKSPILSNTGKNLFDLKSKLFKGEYTYNNPYIYVPISKGVITNNNTTTVSVSCKNLNGSYSQITPKNYYTSHLSTILSNNSGDVDKSIVIRSQSVCHQIAEDGQYYFSYTDSSNSESKMKEYLLSDNFFIQIEHGETQATTCEPYKSNTTTFEQKDDKTIVLRSLPKGVCDTLNIETGEYVQRIGEVVLCGNNDEMWSVDTRKNNRIGFVSRATYGQKVGGGKGAVISDKLVTVTDGDMKYSMDYTITLGAIANYPIVITVPFNAIGESLNTEQSNTVSTNSLKTWLSQNPVTVQYELATPIVTTIDVQGFPYAYKDGHVQLSSGSIEQSLTPKVEYNIATNRGGQITQNTKSLIRQGKLLNDIESKINQIIEATINDGVMLMKLRNK